MLEAPTLYTTLADDEMFNKIMSVRKTLSAEQNQEACDLKQKASILNIKGLLEREYLYEMEHYTIDKRIANLISDMGFAIIDQSADG